MAQVFENIGTSTTTSEGTTITSGIADTWGEYIELVASTSVAWDGFFPNVVFYGGEQILIEFAIGAEGAEVSIFKAWFVGSGNAVAAHGMGYQPIPVASGTRVSARSNSDGASDTPRVSVLGVGTSQTKFLKEGADQESLGFVDTVGGKRGKQIDPEGTANTKGAWVELDASAAGDVDYMTLNFANLDPGMAGDHDWLFDIGIGAIGVETVLIGNLPTHKAEGNDEHFPGVAGPFKVSVSSGTRIAVRCQSSTIVVNDREVFVVLHTQKLATAPSGRIMSSMANFGGLAGKGGMAGQRGGLAA